MSQLLITHGFVKKLASNIRGRYGKEVRHTQVIELISDALGRKAGPMMHALKHSQFHNPQLSPQTGAAHLNTLATIGDLIQAMRTNRHAALPIFSRLLEQDQDINSLLSSLDKGEDFISKTEPSDGDRPMGAEDWICENGIDRDLNSDVAEELFSEQLGRRWRGFRGATRPGKVALIILALACLKSVNSDGRSESSVAAELLRPANGGVNAIHGSMLELIQRYGRDSEVVRIIEHIGSKHAYENTVIHGLMQHLHEIGSEVDPMEMRFVRNLDTSMWCGILNFKRDRFCVQGAGIVSHFLAERIHEGPLVEPFVYPATEDLNLDREQSELPTVH